MRARDFLLEGTVSKLKDLCQIKTNFQDADFWLQRKGSDKTVGTPTKTFSPENIGIKVVATDMLDPDYLYYVMMHIHNTGYWKTQAKGTLSLVSITTSDVANIPIGNSVNESEINDGYVLLEDIEGQKANRAEFIRKQLGNSWNGLPGYEDFEQFIEKVAAIDPSLKGIYMPWIARLAMKNPDMNRAEDLDRLGTDLQAFEQFKSQLSKKDINQYKSFAEVFDAIEPFLKPRPKTKEEKKAEREAAKKLKTREDIVDVYSGPEGWVKIPTTVSSAQYLGQNTRWCTAAKNHNMFDSYNKEDRLFVIYDKASSKRFQLHIQGGQFMDEKDSPVKTSNVPEWARLPIVNWYKENNPNLSLKQMMFLSMWAEDNLGTGTEHEEAIDLMKKYGVL